MEQSAHKTQAPNIPISGEATDIRISGKENHAMEL